MHKNKINTVCIAIFLLISCLFFNGCSKPYDGPGFTIVCYGKET